MGSVMSKVSFSKEIRDDNNGDLDTFKKREKGDETPAKKDDDCHDDEVESREVDFLLFYYISHIRITNIRRYPLG